MAQGTKGRTGVLLLNLGGPDSLAAVRPFLFNLFSDREIIRLGPSFLQKPLAYLIALTRAGKTRAAYSLIGGRSPINEITFAQAQALEQQLNDPVGRSQKREIRVFVGMRYWRPFLGDVVKNIHEQGIEQLVALGLYPHFSVATTGSSLAELKRVLASYPSIRIHELLSWYAHPRYIDALVENIKKDLAAYYSVSSIPADVPEDLHVLFSAHSLPVKFIEEGDPYAEQIMGTITAVAARLRIPWSLSYQSKSGPVAWLEPSTEEKLKELASRGVRSLLVVPISFVSDHIETLYEIDMLYRDMAAKLGMRLERSESLNLSPTFISALGEIVIQGMKEAGWEE